MPYYHVFVLYTDKKGRPNKIVIYNDQKGFVETRVAAPYMKNRAFVLSGVVLHPSSIDEIQIFGSEEKAEKIILPNRKKAVDSASDYVLGCFRKGKVKNVKVYTDIFITSPPEEKEKLTTPTKPIGKKEKVFIVHGRDEKQALRLQKYLRRKLKVDAVMFDDLPEKGRTIIEQLEYIRDNVGYAFVIVTPDDVGCLTEDIEELGEMLAGLKSVKGQTVGKIFGMLHTRARQNVVFELGLFMGALGRKKVCCLLKQDTEERPSDIDGILYKLFNKSVSEIFHEIPEELTEAGYEIKM